MGVETLGDVIAREEIAESRYKRAWNDAIEAAAMAVESLPSKLASVQDGYDGTVTKELCDPSRAGYAKAIRLLRRS